jgi:hypothetical protein
MVDKNKMEKYEKEKELQEDQTKRPSIIEKKTISKEEWEKKYDKYIPETKD